MKRLSTLETTVDDGRIIQDFVIQVLDIHPEDIDVLANEADAYEIIRHVRVGDLLIADGRLKKNVSRIKREIMLSYQKLKKVIMNPKTVKIMAVKKKKRPALPRLLIN